MKSRRFLPDAITSIYVLVLFITIAPQKVLCLEERAKSEKYLKAVQKFADTVIEKGRDTYGNKHTPLFVDGLHAKSLKPVIWKKDGVVQQLAGHSDISTTRKYYLTVRSEDIVSANKVVNSILAKASAN